jgi:RNA polymerase sigma-32 factor
MKNGGIMESDITKYERYIRHIAKKYMAQTQDIDDLIQEGYIGVLNAEKKFDPNFGASFITYADKYIRQKINDFWYKGFNILKLGDTNENKKILSQIYKHQNINDDFSVNMEKLNDVCIKYHIKYEKIIEIVKYIQSPTELIRTNNDGTEYYVTDVLNVDHENDPLNFIETIDKLENYDKLVPMIEEILSVREFDIILSRYLLEKPVTYKQLGEKYGCSGQRIEQIEKQSLKKIKNHLTNIEDYI